MKYEILDRFEGRKVDIYDFGISKVLYVDGEIEGYFTPDFTGFEWEPSSPELKRQELAKEVRQQNRRRK